MTKKTFAFTALLLSFLTSTALLPPHRVSGDSQQARPNPRQMTRDQEAPAGENRVALVIGNAAYRNARKLDNPVNDARAMAKALRECGFDVLGPNGEGYVDLDQRQMIRAVKEFGQRLQANPGVGLFYFAGHGVEANETNYLIPVDADPTDETDLKYQGLDIKDALDQFIGNRLNIVILDACRDNPFARSFKRSRGGGGDGLKKVEAPTGTLIAYATAPRQTASDGTGVNGLYTEQLLEAIRIKGLPIEQVFKRVRIRVQANSKGAQIPWENSSLNGDFYFIPEGSGATASAPPPVADDPAPKVTREKQFGTLVVTSAQVGVEILIDGKSQGVSESRGEKFKVEKLVAGRTVEITARLKGRDPVVKRVEIEPNREVQIGVEFELPSVLSNAAGIEFVRVPKGSFVMGSEQADQDRWTKDVFAKFNRTANFLRERPSHRVTISRDFYVGKFEVTQKQWRYVAEKLPKVKRDLDSSPSFFKGDDLPVEQVSWEDCEEFVLRLNRLGDGFEYALPTEAEWEYACRANTSGDYAGDLDAMGWYANNSGKSRIDSYQAFYVDAGLDYNKYYENTLKPNECQTHPVGQKRPNAFGLYDMHGNVYEWCADWFDEKYYESANPTDPTGPSSAQQYRVLRGGSWNDFAINCRSAIRYRDSPTNRSNYYGFRVVVFSART
jgi:formylglycine-generating enzyme required for sulfatase activity